MSKQIKITLLNVIISLKIYFKAAGVPRRRRTPIAGPGFRSKAMGPGPMWPISYSQEGKKCQVNV